MSSNQWQDKPELTEVNDDCRFLIWNPITQSTNHIKAINLKSYFGGSSLPTFTKLNGTPFGATPPYTPGTGFEKAFDGDTSTIFDYLYSNGAHVGIDLGASGASVIKKIRFYPRDTYANRMIGGIFQVGNTSNNSGYLDLYTISTTPPQFWNEVIVDSGQAYRYLRYLAPSNSYGNVAEIEFYK